MQASASINALAVRYRTQTQSSRFQGTGCLSNGGRKVVGGQWPKTFQSMLAIFASRKSNNRHARAHFVRQSHRRNDQSGIAGTWTKRDEQDLVFVVVH